MDSIAEYRELVKTNMPHWADLAQQAAELVTAGEVWQSTRGMEVVDHGRQFTVKTTKTGPRCTCGRANCPHRAAAWLARNV